MDLQYCSSLYSSWLFHMRKTIVAMARARLSLGRLGLVAPSSFRHLRPPESGHPNSYNVSSEVGNLYTRNYFESSPYEYRGSQNAVVPTGFDRRSVTGLKKGAYSAYQLDAPSDLEKD
jgi:hypothetical protein